MSASLEPGYKVWNDGTGEHWIIGRDRDGLDMIEVAYVTERGVRGPGISWTVEQAELVIKALTLMVKAAKEAE